MKLGITGKLVLLLLATTILLVGAMVLATRWSFQKGFLDYLTEAELGRLDRTVSQLAMAYRKEGSWDFIRGSHRNWSQFLPYNEQGQPIMPAEAPNPNEAAQSFDTQTALTRPRRPPPGSGMRPLPPPRPGGSSGGPEVPQLFGNRPPPPPPNDRTGLSTRLRLLDKNRLHVIGPADTTGKALLRPIELDGKVIGYLSLTPQPVPASELDQSFRNEQLNAIYPIGIGALLLALLVGIPMGRHLLKPVKELAEGSHALAQGRFDTRLAAHSQDELGRLAHDFNALAKALERNELLRRQGMADISHELRTPLALLRGEIEAIQDGIRPLDSAQLAKLHDAVMQLSHLVDDLYDLALTDAGALSYRKEPVDLCELLQDAISTAEHSLSKKGLSIRADLPETLPLLGDHRRLRQVMDNLLKNSRRYTDSGGAIQVSAWRQGNQVSFKVEDTAPGVDAETLSRLFDRFYRGEASRNRASGGAGLGLSICRNIVEAHQGSISAQPSPLGGLQIIVTLPVDTSIPSLSGTSVPSCGVEG